MNTIIGLSSRQRADIFSGAAQKLGFGNEVIIEKDFWVCWILRQLFSGVAGFGPHLIFKGGTSLSKVYGAINRFSEDVDITVGRELLGMTTDDDDPEKAPNPSQKKKRIEALRAGCSRWVTEVLSRKLEGGTREVLGPTGWNFTVDEADEDRLTLLFNYPSVLAAPAAGAYVQRAVRIECGAKADLWPVTEATIKPYVAEAYPTQVLDASVPVRALSAERTFWEKATILHAEAHRPADKEIKRNFSRHYADSAELADHPGGISALRDAGLRERVVEFKEAFYRSAWTNFPTAVPGSFKLLPANAHAATLETDYRRMQREMYFGPSLDWPAVVARLRKLEDEINGPPP
jgi:Nucleotidyl transferase AbiEii toxin, Type IV TA system